MMALRIDDECREIIWAINGAQSRRTIVLATRSQSGLMERDNGAARFGMERKVEPGSIRYVPTGLLDGEFVI